MARKKARAPWTYSYGEAPDRVQVREKYVGGRLYLRSRLDADAPLGFRVRDEDGEPDAAAVAEAKKRAKSRNLELRIERSRDTPEPARLTVGQAAAQFQDPARGAMPKSASARKLYTRLLRRWESHLGTGTPWQRVVRADVEALLRVLRDQEGHPMEAWHAVKVLRRLHAWLDGWAGYEGLRNPTKGIQLSAVPEEHEPRKPRYSQAEAAALIAARHHPDLDPRWALFLALMDDSGRRGVSIRSLWRSDLGKLPPQAAPPSAEDAPYGWIWFQGVKGQKGGAVLLTDFQRRELDLAFATWLRRLEAAYRAGTLPDYRLIPGEYFPASGAFEPGQAGVTAPVSYQTTKVWLRAAERAAKVPHVAGRGLHGIRRHWVDLTRAGMGIEGAQFAGDWSSRETVEGYAEEAKWDVRAAARRLHEKKRESGS